jgi:hypothetical protein
MALFLLDPQQGPQIKPPRAGQLRFAPLPLQETQVILAINRLPVLLLFSGYLQYSQSGIILCPLLKDKKEKRTDESINVSEVSTACSPARKTCRTDQAGGLYEQGAQFGDHRTNSTLTAESRKCNDSMHEKDDEITHLNIAARTAKARNYGAN